MITADIIKGLLENTPIAFYLEQGITVSELVNILQIIQQSDKKLLSLDLSKLPHLLTAEIICLIANAPDIKILFLGRGTLDNKTAEDLENIFSQLHNGILSLDISFSTLSRFSAAEINTFFSKLNIINMDLSYCNLFQIEENNKNIRRSDFHLINFPQSLKTLSLDGNFLKFLDNQSPLWMASSKLIHVENISLKHNELSRLSFPEFENLLFSIAAHKIDLRQNGLNAINPEAKQPFIELLLKTGKIILIEKSITEAITAYKQRNITLFAAEFKKLIQQPSWKDIFSHSVFSINARANQATLDESKEFTSSIPYEP